MAGIKIPISIDNTNFAAAAREAQTAVHSVAGEVRGLESDTKDAAAGIKDMLTQAAAFGGISLGFAGAKEFVSQIVDIRKEMQGYQTALSVLLGDQGRANVMFEELKQFAVTTPLMFKDLASGAQTMLGFNIEAEKVVPTLKAIGDISMGDAQKFQNLTLAFSQMSATGKLMGQDLLQMINAGFNPLTEMSRKTGKSISELKEEMSDGAISAEAVADAFMSATREGGKFHGMLEKQGKNIGGVMNTLSGAVDDMFNSLGRQTEGVITGSIEMLTTLVQNWESVGAAILTAAGAFGTYKAMEMAVTAFDTTATNLAFDAEIKKLRELIPVKQEAMAADLQQAVSSGRLTQAKAQEVAALRQEAQAQLQALAAEEAKAKAAYAHALEQHLLAKRGMDVAKSQMKIALASGSAEEVAAAKRAASVAKTELHNAALAKNTAHQNLNAAASQRAAAAASIDAAAQGADAAATGVLAQAKMRLSKAMAAVNASFLASPLFWIAATIATVTFAVYKLVTAESESEKAIRRSSEAWEEFGKRQEEFADNVRGLISTCQNLTKTTLQQYQAYNRLKEVFPDLIKKYSTLKKLQQADKDEIDTILNQAIESEAEKKTIDDVTAAQEKLTKARRNYQMVASSGIVDSGALAALAKQVAQAEEVFKVAQQKREEYVREQARALAQAAEDAKPIEIRVQEAEGNKSRLQTAVDLMNKATEAMTKEVTAPMVTPPDIDEVLAEVEEKLAEARKEYEENPANLKAQLDVESLEGVKRSIQEAKSEMETTGINIIPIRFQLEVDTTQKELERAMQNYVETVEEQTGKIGSAKENKKYWEEQKKNAQNELDGLTAVEAAGKRGLELKKRIQEYDQKISAYSTTGTRRGNDAAKQAAEDARKLTEVRERQGIEQERQAKDIALKTKKAHIEGLQEGHEKVMEQIALDYESERVAIEREREDMRRAYEDAARDRWEAENANAVRNNPNAWETSGARGAFNAGFVWSEADSKYFEEREAANEARRARREAEQQKAEQSAYDALLQQFGDYYEQREAIERSYRQRIADATTDGDAQMLSKQMKKELADVDSRFGRSTSRIQKLWKDTGRHSRKEIKAMIDELKLLQSTISDGQISDDEGTLLASLGFSEQDIQLVKTGERSIDDIIERIKQLRQKLAESSTAAQNFWDTVSNSDGSVDMDKIGQSFNDMMAQISAYAQGLQMLSNVFSNHRIKGAMEDIQTMVGDMGQGAAVGGSVGGGWGAIIGAAVGAASGIGKLISQHADDDAINRIKQLDRQIKSLEHSYDNLADSVDRAYGSDKTQLINDEVANLARQNQLIQEQIRAEQSKKDSDDNAIENYRETIYQNQQRIRELREQAKDAIFGSDIRTAIESFAEAYADAWAENTNRTKTAKDQVREMMQQMVRESIKAATSASGAMERIRDKMSDFFRDGVFTAEEQAEMYREAEALQHELDARFGWADDLLDRNGNFAQTGTSGGFTAMSQESADELNGRFASGQITVESILQQTMLIYAANQQLVEVQSESNETLQEIRNIMIGMSGNVEDIAVYTKRMADTVGPKLDIMTRKLSSL